MSYFAAVLARQAGRWNAAEVDLDGCESLTDLGQLAADLPGDLRLLVIEQDDEYAAFVRMDADDDNPRAFLTDGHAADAYPVAAVVAEELSEIGEDELSDDEDAPPAHDSAPFGDADIAEDLGTPATELLAMCAHEGTLPIDVILAVCERAGCAEVFEGVRV
jgi:putative tRNA adenosine deaminase-associated protein